MRSVQCNLKRKNFYFLLIFRNWKSSEVLSYRVKIEAKCLKNIFEVIHDMFIIKKMRKVAAFGIWICEIRAKNGLHCDVAEWRHKCRKVYIVQNPITLIFFSRFSSNFASKCLEFPLFSYSTEKNQMWRNFFIP